MKDMVLVERYKLNQDSVSIIFDCYNQIWKFAKFVFSEKNWFSVNKNMESIFKCTNVETMGYKIFRVT